MNALSNFAVSRTIKAAAEFVTAVDAAYESGKWLTDCDRVRKAAVRFANQLNYEIERGLDSLDEFDDASAWRGSKRNARIKRLALLMEAVVRNNDGPGFGGDDGHYALVDVLVAANVAGVNEGEDE